MRIALLVLTALPPLVAAQPELTLRYDRPAAKWTEAIPVGNGRIGAMVFGGIEDERLQINESTLWGGSPHDYANPEAYSHLDEIRQLIFAGRVDEAQKLSASFMGRPKLLMPYQPFCDLRMHLAGVGTVTDYHRELNLDHAVSVTEYSIGATRYRREVFVSYPDQVLVLRMTASGPARITFTLDMDSPQPGVQIKAIANETLQLAGRIQPRQNSPRSWTGSWETPGMRFAAALRVSAEGGSVRAVERHLEISDGKAVTILFSNATSFKTYRDIDGDPLKAVKDCLDKASAKSFDELRRAHITDFDRLFSRVELSLGEDYSTDSTDVRIKSFEQNNDPALVALYFAFGRYLLISSSRPGGQPANLQGIWNQDLSPAWGSKWTTNINLEMNYWQADSGDLWETEQPLWDLIRDLRITGAATARVQYHSDGWVLHHNTDLWRATAPVDGPWGIWPMGEVCLANQMWDHYEFSGDREFLRQQAYPAMKEAADFILGSLVQAPAGTPFAGRLVTNPSTSPENQYILNGRPESLTYAPTMDIELTRELFDNCRRAAEILRIDADLQAKLDHTKKRLPPLQIGKRGQLQEWIEDYGESEPNHRHVSHLYALYPGHDISLNSTPELAAAAQRTLELRGDGGTGWSEVWRAALWARLHNPERAYNNLKLLITKNTLPNMFDLCPPFQIDGNLGGPAAITELLVQSTSKEIYVLPALPHQWPSGALKGARVRGGGKINISWKDGHLTELTLQADHDIRYRLIYGEKSSEVAIHAGKAMLLDDALHEVVR